MRRASIAAALGLWASHAQAQEIHYWPAPAAPVATGQLAEFPAGTPITLTTRTQVSTKDSRSGDRLYLEVAEPLVYRGQTVVPAGATAVAEVARADRNGYFGRKGKIDIRLLQVQTPSGPVRLGGRAHDEGTDATAASIATIMFVSPLGFLIHGTSAHLSFGTVVRAYLAEPLAFSPQPPQMRTASIARSDAARPLPARFDAAVLEGARVDAAHR